MRSHFNIINDNSEIYSNITADKTFAYPFLNFNGRTRPHRSQFVDELSKRNYLDKGIVTYHMMPEPDKTFKWKYHTGLPISIDDGFTTYFSSYKFDEKFLQSFLHIPTETDVNVVLISEKTATPILCGLPFLTLGAQGFHRRLKELGFELYTEIFDYSFDEVDDLTTRIELILKNVDFVVNNFHKVNEMYELIKHKIEKNKIHAKKFFQSWDTIPELIKDRYEQIVSWNTDSISEVDFDLIEKFREIKDKEITKTHFKPRPGRFRYDYWHDFNFEKIVADVERHKPLNITLFGENEWLPWVTPAFRDAVNKYDIAVTIVTGSPKSAWHNDNKKKLGINKLKIEHWPTFWLYYAEKLFREHGIKNTIDYNDELSIPFSCLNNRGHLHRCFAIDLMQKYNLLDKGAVTWINPLNENTNFKWKYFKNRQILLNDNMVSRQDSFILASEYKSSFFDFVTECCTETVMLSEKTVRPLLLKKPFAVLGAHGFHKYLTTLGFKLYTEIIDYSFDDVEDLETRTELFVRNMLEVSKIKDFSTVYKDLLPKIEHNYSRLMELTKDKSYIPIEVLTVISMSTGNPDTPKIHYLQKYTDFA
jgi:hypothetical protein